MPDISDDIPKAVKKEIIRVLKKAQRLINKQDSKSLKILSEQTVTTAGIYQDKDSVSLAVIVYAISKLLERWGYESEYAEELRNLLGSSQFALEENDVEVFRRDFRKIFDFIGAVDKKFKTYIVKVIEKAEIKKGGTLYTQGLSIGRAAELLGIGQWELMSYVGKISAPDETAGSTGVKDRVEFARGLFSGKTS